MRIHRSNFHGISLFLVVMVFFCGGDVLAQEDILDRAEENLLDSLLARYHKLVRPKGSQGEPVTVSVAFSLLAINSLGADQILSTTGLLILEWMDRRLSWNPDEHGQINRIHLPPKQVWTPEIALINGAEDIFLDFSKFELLVNSNGRVHWEPGGLFKTICDFDVTYYPNDRQKCSWTLGTWSYTTKEINLTSGSGYVNLDSYAENGEFEIKTTRSRRVEFFFDCCPDERFSNVMFLINLKRRKTYYVINIILPTILTSTLLLMIFACPADHKVEICLVVLISFRLLMLDVANSIPKTSDAVSLLSIFLTFTLVVATMSMMLAVFILNLHYVSDKPVPRWIRKIVLDVLAKVVCIGKGQQKQGIKIGKTKDDHETSLAMESKPDEGKKGEKVDYEDDWKQVANVLDRCFFWIVFLAIIVSLIIFLHPVIGEM